MSLLKPFLQFISDRRLFSRKDRLLVAVSGGIDSVCLLHLCKAAGFEVSVAHVNFLLRGAESDGDERFVSELAASYGFPFYLHREDAAVYAEAKKVTVQVAAREIRYRFFYELISKHIVGDYILTAHHADDNAETLLMNFLKGTGMEGLTGISAVNGRIRRPLLFAERRQIEVYRAEHNLSYREDVSNLTVKYTRNFIRLEVMPLLEKIFPAVKANLGDNLIRFEEIASLYHAEVAQFFKRHLVESAGVWKVSIEALKKSGAVRTLLYEWLRKCGFSVAQSVEAEKLLYAESGKMIISANFRLLRDRKHLVLSDLPPDAMPLIVINEGDTKIEFAGGVLNIHVTNPSTTSEGDYVALLAADKIKYPLLLRKWRVGDYMYPLGMQKKKKVARILSDKKCSLYEKERIWVIESDKKIIWLVGHRIDDRFKITDKTKQVLRIRLSPKK